MISHNRPVMLPCEYGILSSIVHLQTTLNEPGSVLNYYQESSCGYHGSKEISRPFIGATLMLCIKAWLQLCNTFLLKLSQCLFHYLNVCIVDGLVVAYRHWSSVLLCWLPTSRCWGNLTCLWQGRTWEEENTTWVSDVQPMDMGLLISVNSSGTIKSVLYRNSIVIPSISSSL